MQKICEDMAGKNLVIVESPTKAGKIQGYLGGDFIVKSSRGHIRDLDEKSLSVDVEHGFSPQYVIPSDKKKIVAELRKLSEAADVVWLASDEDREGEAISWHLTQTLGRPASKAKRIVFHEITKDAILYAVEHPRAVDMNLVDAQQARRVLDRLVGFELSPVLWRKIQPKLSAGRVQSVALRLIVDREKEIMAFRKESFYRVEAEFIPAGHKKALKAVLDSRFSTEAEARSFLESLLGAEFSVVSAEKKETSRHPAPPFTTSTLQQEASRKLHFPVSSTMRIAQALYERGLITYMRTDSVNLSNVALGAAKKYIESNFGAEYSSPTQYKTQSKGAQQAHEAIRPTNIFSPTIEGTAQEQRLYGLIWRRTLASQMASARLMNTTVKVGTPVREEKFTIQGSELLFDGFMRLYGHDDAEDGEGMIIPELNPGTVMAADRIDALCKFTAPPARFTEGTLVKKLEDLEIGRPSTYGPTIATLTTGRGYVVKGDKDGEKVEVENLTLRGGGVSTSRKVEVVGAEKGRLLPQEIGMMVTDFLIKNFPKIVDYDFTASVEKDFDAIAEGEMPWVSAISSFYTPFHAHVGEVLGTKEYSNRISRVIGTDPATGEQLVAKFGQYGPYVQKGDGENRQFASLGKEQLIETLTLEDALKLFSLPRTVGEIDGIPVVAMKGRYGPYIKFGETNVSIPKGKDPLTITLDECRKLVDEASSKTPLNAVLAEFGDGIQVINGRYGPYIKQGDANYRIPRGTDVAGLSEAACREIIASSGPTSPKKSRFKRNN